MIYFIQEIGLFRNRVKIGLTDNLKNRLIGLRGSSPSSLKVLLILPGDIQTEIVYHERFAKYRLHGEWFKFGLKLRLFVWLNQHEICTLNNSNYSSPEDDIVKDDIVKDTQLSIPKHHPDNVNRIIDELLIENPDIFPAKTRVCEAVGINGGSKYKKVIEIYESRLLHNKEKILTPS